MPMEDPTTVVTTATMVTTMTDTTDQIEHTTMATMAATMTTTTMATVTATTATATTMTKVDTVTTATDITRSHLLSLTLHLLGGYTEDTFTSTKSFIFNYLHQKFANATYLAIVFTQAYGMVLGLPMVI